MTAKYLRELAMRAFNEFWCARVPGLRPTAGYPVDARRFKLRSRECNAALGIDDHILWRNRKGLPQRSQRTRRRFEW